MTGVDLFKTNYPYYPSIPLTFIEQRANLDYFFSVTSCYQKSN